MHSNSIAISVVLKSTLVTSSKNIQVTHYLIKRQSGHHIKNSQLICSANQLTGFYMMANLTFNVIMKYYCEIYLAC